MKKYLILVVVFALLSVLGFANDDAHRVSYEFVSESGEALPEAVMEKLPENKDAVEVGSVIVNEPLEDVETDDAVYSFIGWNFDEYTIDAEDVVFIGTWKITPKETAVEETPAEQPETVEQPEVVEPQQPSEEGEPASNGEPYMVHFKFFKAFTGGDENLPAEIKAIMPADYEETLPLEDIRINLPFSVWETWTFMGWEPFWNDDGSLLMQGIWFDSATPVNIKELTPVESSDVPSLLGADDVLWSGFGNGWVARAQSSYYAGVNQFLLCDGPGGNDGTTSCEIAWCIEDGARVPSVGTPYYYAGRNTGREAEIIAMGIKNGHSQGAIQAAIWNYFRPGIAWTTNGENCDPDSDDYSAGDTYGYRVDEYDSDGTQNFAINPSYWVKRVPHGDVRVKKLASDASILRWSNNYTLSGAVYGIYSNPACTNLIKSVTTGADGVSNTVDISPGTVYIKEITASRGFERDPNVYTLGVVDYGNYTVESIETPILLDISLRKIGPLGEEVVYPIGSILDIVLDGNPYGTWTTDGTDYVMQDIHLGAKIEVTETRAADGYVIAEKRIIRTNNP